MQSLSEIRSLLAAHGLNPLKRFGQNFLHDHNLIKRLVDTAWPSVQPGSVVLEIGPGTGALTEALLERIECEQNNPPSMIACEIDRGLCAILRERFNDRITLIEGDALPGGRSLNADVVAAIAQRPFTLIANLPYQVASPLMAALLVEFPSQCVGQFVTIQKEVAERLTAAPSTKAYGPLGIIVQALAHVEMIATLPPSCFWPQPQVSSAMVAIRPTEPPDVLKPIESRRAFARFIVELFGFRRKQIGGIWGRDHANWPTGIDPTCRAEQLTTSQLIALWEWRRNAP